MGTPLFGTHQTTRFSALVPFIDDPCHHMGIAPAGHVIDPRQPTKPRRPAITRHLCSKHQKRVPSDKQLALMHDMQKSGGFVLGDTPFRQIYFVEIIKPNRQGLLLGVILIVTHLGAANRAVAII